MAPVRRPAGTPVDTFAVLPDPGQAGSLDDLVERLRLLKVWAGDPSYEWIKDRVRADWTAAGRPAAELPGKTTVVDCFRAGRQRLNTDLVVAVVQALHPDVGYATQWRQALRVVGGQVRAASQVRVRDRLPGDPDGFTGRTAELDRLGLALRPGPAATVAVATIAGMPGVGKTRLAVRTGHLLTGTQAVDRVLFVDLRGFDPDPGQPPADPAAVLDGFLRLLGVPGQQIPYGLAARTAAYRGRLAGTHTLVVLDNAAGEAQVRPLLPATPGCPALVTSRRGLAGLAGATRLSLDVFTPAEALAFLAAAAPQATPGADPQAADRIAERCGYLPLALGLVAAQIRDRPGWTLSDHADRLAERHRDRHLDSGVQLALDLSYQHLPAALRRLLRYAAGHPGPDLDAYTAAALCGTDLPAARAGLRHLCRDHLLHQVAADRYAFHDLVRVHAAGRATDEDAPAERRAALTRVFDHFLATAAAAMDRLHPAEAHRRPPVAAPATPVPALADPAAARAWLDTERPALVAVAGHAATHGWPGHATALSTILFRYLTGGHLSDALTVCGHAHQAAHRTDDPAGQAQALTNLGATEVRVGRYAAAAGHLRQALHRYRQSGDVAGEARALTNLGVVAERLGRFGQAAEHHAQALTRYRQVGDRTGEARALGNLGIVEGRLGRYQPATGHLRQALALSRRAGDQTGEASHLNNLGDVERRMGHAAAAGHLDQALALYRRLANRAGQAGTLDSLGALRTRQGRPELAEEHYRKALAIVREISEPQGEACVLNGLGEAATVARRTGEALGYHAAARTLATEIGDRYQLARAHAGLGHAYRDRGDRVRAARHHRYALGLYTEFGTPEADQLRALLATGEPSPARSADDRRAAAAG